MIAGPTPQLSPITSAPHPSKLSVKASGVVPKDSVAIGHDGHLRNDWQITQLSNGTNRLVHLGDILKRSQSRTDQRHLRANRSPEL
jgi:hypothetical protein